MQDSLTLTQVGFQTLIGVYACSATRHMAAYIKQCPKPDSPHPAPFLQMKANALTIQHTYMIGGVRRSATRKITPQNLSPNNAQQKIVAEFRIPRRTLGPKHL